jgi:hypothetical protein
LHDAADHFGHVALGSKFMIVVAGRCFGRTLMEIETGEVWQCLNDGRLAGRQPVRHQQKNRLAGGF